MKKILVLTSFITLVAFTLAFTKNEDPEYIPPSKQRTGDAAKGYAYLTTGDYIRSGIPYKTFLLAAGKSKKNLLERDGLNENISFEYTAVKAPNGEVIVSPNCFQCHAQEFDGKLIIGLGNTEIDFNDKRFTPAQLAFLETFLKKDRSQYEAASDFLTVGKTISPYLHTDTRGVNLADHLTAVLVAHRDPETLKWNEKASMEISKEIIPTDTPAWWLLKKKNGMFYTGFGRGDFGKFLMGSNLLTVKDSAEASEVFTHMPDVLSYIYSIKPPAYPKAINKQLAKAGRQIFQNNCSRCHGRYGPDEFYPNLLIPSSIIQTDSLLYSSNHSNENFIDWFNKSWFVSGDHPAKLQTYKGYIAPPLDGVWITAPYLHNGSVPDIASLLDSKKRPTVWTRNFNKPEYDHENLGWKYIPLVDRKKPKGSYDTNVRGYSNKGHYFGDHLTEKERKAVIEYLKTL